MSRSSKIELLYFCVLIESLAGYAYDEKHNGRHTDGKHDDLYPHGTKHAKHDKDATFAYQIVETDRTFTYDAAGKLVSATEYSRWARTVGAPNGPSTSSSTDWSSAMKTGAASLK